MIRIEHLRKEYGSSCPIKDVSTIINKGDVVCIIGPSGTGKSTFLRMINLLEKPTSGKIFIDEEEITAKDYKPERARRRMSMVFQSFNLFNHLSVIENLVVPQVDLLKKDKNEAFEKSMDMLERVGMKRQYLNYPSSLSGGQKQRVAIARALVMEPEVILFDEPTSALDPIMVDEVKTIMKDLAKQGQTMIIVTHDMKLAEDVANRVLYMDQGGIYEDDKPEIIFHNPKRTRTKAFIENLNVLKLSVHNNFDPIKYGNDLNNYISELGINYIEANKIRMIYDELFYELLINENCCNDIRLLISYDTKKNNFFINCKYGGAEINVLEKDSVSSKLIGNIITNINYSKIEEKQYTNCLTFESK